jgi:hypothetical protein
MWWVAHSGTSPLPVGERKAVVLISAPGAKLGRGKESTHLNEVLAAPPGFVLYLLKQFPECGIQPRFRVLGFRQRFSFGLHAELVHLATWDCGSYSCWMIVYNKGEEKANQIVGKAPSTGLTNHRLVSPPLGARLYGDLR